ncbi:MAG: hypothetical protein DYG99_14930 [Bacteroidetes bacterium CHB5]|nr:hypothetical protein [Bacteroidetes bacterium CHB5]
MNSTSIITIGLLICSSSIFSQTVSKSFNGTVAGAVCPEFGVQYEVSLPTGFAGCLITWTITNGTEQSRSGNTIIIKWNDTPGAKAKLKATFSNCGSGNESNNGKVSNEFEELILSVKNQSWGSFGNSVNVDYCTKGQVLITMPACSCKAQVALASQHKLKLLMVGHCQVAGKKWVQAGPDFLVHPLIL